MVDSGGKAMSLPESGHESLFAAGNELPDLLPNDDPKEVLSCRPGWTLSSRGLRPAVNGPSALRPSPYPTTTQMPPSEAIALFIKTDGAVSYRCRIFRLPRETLGFEVFLGQTTPIARN